jgi:hypothetical protein
MYQQESRLYELQLEPFPKKLKVLPQIPALLLGCKSLSLVAK